MIDEFIWEMAWRRALVIAFLEIASVVFAGYLVLMVQFFRKGVASVGILCSFCLIPCFLPAGVLIALIFGWWSASHWGCERSWASGQRRWSSHS